ncbi:hypothetical protein CF319_g8180 [Tilletia indica]|nr:hypothetical protein CF319_g8180 [Tilletia indica]
MSANKSSHFFKPTNLKPSDLFGPPMAPKPAEVLPRAGEKHGRESSPFPEKDAAMPDQSAPATPVKKVRSSTKKRNNAPRAKLQLTGTDIEKMDLQASGLPRPAQDHLRRA